jgi:HD-GYP domain-containing protein (c-di-GMP phosphodiesterase class II)
MKLACVSMSPPNIVMRHQHGSTPSLSLHVPDRVSLARLLGDDRVTIAENIVARVGNDRVTSLLLRTLIVTIAKSIETTDPDVVLHWGRMARGAHSPHVVLELISIACDVAAEYAERLCDDLSTVLVFLEVVQEHAREALMIAEPVMSSDEMHRPIIESVLAMLRARDEATCAHSRATGLWCRRLANGLGLTTGVTDRIVKAGVLHDVGKIATPDAILLKAGPLDAREWAIMQQHAAFGGEILAQIPSLAQYSPIVRAHHERIDGRGYPDGFAGELIPFEARVVAVADAFHAMISDRPYRAALSYGAAIAVLGEGRGTQWDAEVVDAMVIVAASARSRSADADLAPLSEYGPVAASSPTAQTLAG